MNSVSLLALLIFTSASRAASSSRYSDFSEMDGEYYQNKFFEDEAVTISNPEESTQSVTTIQPFQTDHTYSQTLADDQTTGVEANYLVESEGFLNTAEHPASVLSAMNEAVTDKYPNNFLVYPFDYQNSKTPFQSPDTKPNQTPTRRGIKEWKVPDDLFDSNNVAWSADYYSSYSPKIGQSDYVEDKSYSEDKSQEGPLVIVAGDYKDQNTNAKHPQYFQKNYYYNYYPLVRDKNRWNEDEEGSKQQLQTPAGRKIPAANPCRQYLEFLRYAFQSLEENSEYYYEDNPERMFQTRLLGPTFYIDNSGKISQVNTNGNSIQVADGVSPDSRLTIYSMKTTDPNPVTQYSSSTIKAPTSSDEFYSDYNEVYGSKTWFGKNKPKNSQKNATATPQPTLITYTTQWRDERMKTMATLGEQMTTPKGEDGTTIRKKFDEPMQRNLIIGDGSSSTQVFSIWPLPSATVPTTTANVNPIKVKTIIRFRDPPDVTKPDEADCKDKMLPCPDTVNITYPLNGYCNRYVTCESGRAIRRTCEDGLHFNLIIKSCDLPHNSFCTYVCPQPNGHFGIPGDCGGYFVCKNSNPEYRMCPPRMHWDINKSICTFSQLSSCPMKCFKGNEVRPYEGDCKAYIVCLNGIPYYHKCPPKTKFDGLKLVCVPDHLSTCKDDPRLLTKTLNPNALCRNVQMNLNVNSWCRSFMPFDKQIY